MKKSRLIIMICGLAVFGSITWFVVSGSSMSIDNAIREAFYSIRNDFLTVIMKGITYMGNWEAIVVICLALLIFKKTRISVGVPLAAAAIVSQIAYRVIKIIVQRPRPPLADRLIEQGGFSFPSGHALTSLTVYVLLIYFVRTQIKSRKTANVLTALLMIPTIFIGLSRIYLGVHYPTDVLGGWSLAVVLVAVGMAAVEKTQKKL